MERKSAAEPWNGATSPGEPKGYVLRKPPYQDGYFLRKTMPGSHVVQKEWNIHNIHGGKMVP